MKPCPQCKQTGKPLDHEAIKTDENGGWQILDYTLECPTHGVYEGNFKPGAAPDRERIRSPFLPPEEPLTEEQIQEKIDAYSNEH